MIQEILPGVAAIDIGQERFHVAVAQQPVRNFGTFTCDIKLVASYLQEQGVRRVAMEATGVYWIPLHDHLEEQGFEVTLFNGARAKNLPGRKSDVQDCQWHAMLHSHGLLQPCFVPPPDIRQMRSYYRLREDHISLASSHIQHMQKALDLMNVRFHNVISQLQGKSGLRVVEAILAGERDAETLSQLCDTQILKKKREQVIKSLEGNWQEHHLFALRQGLEGYKFYQRQVAACDREIERLLEKLTEDRQPPEQPPGAVTKPPRHNAPQIKDLHGKLLMLCGGRDPSQISGIGQLSFLKLVSEIGTDLGAWPTQKRFVSWLGLAPRQHNSGKMKRRVWTANTKAGQIFREAAQPLARSKHTALGAFYRRIRGRRGAAVAIKAVARKLACFYYDVMTKGMAHAEIGVQRYEEQYRRQQQRYLERTARSMGMILLPAQHLQAILAQTPAAVEVH